MRTASQLTRNCGLITKLSQARPRRARVQATADEGTRFGKLVEDWVEGRDPQEPAVLDYPWCWFETMRRSWQPPAGTRSEVPLGLSWDGDYVEVTEPSPHVYIPVMGGDPAMLATAGRADLVWLADSDQGRMVVVADLKRSAWRHGDPARHPQLMALGCAAARKHHTEWVVLKLYDAQDGIWESSDPLRVDDLLPEVLEICALPEDEARPGPWCDGCWERGECPAGGSP